MAESAVSFLLEKLQTLLENEVRHLTGVCGEVEAVRDELELMKAFLQEADAMEDADQGLRAWVKQVRELAYDAEDVIDHFLLRFEPASQSGLSKIARVLTTLRARRRVASDLQKIKSRAITISEGRQRYSHNWNSSLIAGKNNAESVSVSELRSNARLVPESLLVGVENRKEELLSWIEGEEVRGFAVQGMGGLGKTTLVGQIYRDDHLRRFELRAWVTVSESFDEREILVNIIRQLYKAVEQSVPEETYSNDNHSLKEEIQGLLREQNYLIVLDDVWTMNAWESLRHAFPESNSGGRLIVTTRVSSVANIVAKDVFGGRIYAMSPLNSEESWDLFCRRIFRGQPCPNHLAEDSRLILERCKGLPLAIVSISGLLASRDASKGEWERVRRSLEARFHVNDQLSDMERILSLSFNDLRYDLKSCLLYLSLFPEDWFYKKQYIVKLWIAEGLVQQMGNATPEEVGDLYFSDLIARSLVQVTLANDLGEDYFQFQVHDLMREILLRKCKAQNFGTTSNEQNLSVPESARRLIVDTSLEKLEGDCDFSRLRSLICLSSSEGSIISSKSVSEFLGNRGVRLLKVLDCSHFESLDKFPKFVTTQYNLRYLNLSHTKLASIPRSIGRLRKLETLNLINTLVEKLPEEILQIHGLRHLTAYRETKEGSSSKKYFNGVRVPTGLENLKSLQTLSFVKVSQRLRKAEAGLIGSLGKLKQLRDLRIQELREEYGPVLCSLIEQLTNLHILGVESKDEDEILDVQHISSPPPSLRNLSMRGRLTKLPSWVSDKLGSLVLLSLKWSKLTVDPLESLQALPNLVYLEFLDKAFDGEELCFRDGGFKMLKKVSFGNLERLRRVTVEEGSMPVLEVLWLKDCKLLEEVPSGIEFLANLKKLYFVNVGDQFVKRLRSSSDDGDFERIKHVPYRVMGSFNAEGNWEPIFE